MQQSPKIYESLIEIENLFSEHHERHEIFDLILAKLIEATDSKIGYIGKIVSSAPTTADDLHMFALTDISWDAESHKLMTSNKIDGPKHNGMHKYMASSCAPLFWDDFSSEVVPRYPLPHVVIKTLMIIPLIFKGAIIGQIALANRTDSYNSDDVAHIDIIIKRAACIMQFYIDAADQKTVIRSDAIRRAKNMFMANVSHEIRTPLNCILGMIALLLDSPMEEHQHKCVLIMREAGYNLLGLINEILDISKLEAGKMKLNLGPVGLHGLIGSCYDLIGLDASNKGITVDIKFGPGCPKNIVCDGQRLKQMVSNLLSNAVKFTDRGSIITTIELADDECIKQLDLQPLDSLRQSRRLKLMSVGSRSFADLREYGPVGASPSPSPPPSSPSSPPAMFTSSGGVLKRDRSPPPKHVLERRNRMDVSRHKVSVPTILPSTIPIAEESSPAGGEWYYIKFSVKDTGIGIKEQDMSKLFYSFMQIDTATTKNYKGTGLGLAITWELCKLMKGNISLRSVFGEGSTFYFVIPVQKVNDTEKLDPSTLEGKRVLIIDDVADNLGCISDAFSKWGVVQQECMSIDRAITSYIGNPRYTFDIGIVNASVRGLDAEKLMNKIDGAFPMIVIASGAKFERNVFNGHISRQLTEQSLLKSLIKTLSKFVSPRDMNYSVESGSAPPHEDIYSSTNSTSTSSSSSPPPSPTPAPISPSKLDDRYNSIKVPGKKSTTGVVDDEESRRKKLAQQENYYERAERTDINILIVDDSESNITTLSMMLQNIGYKNIDVARSGPGAVKMVKSTRKLLAKKDKYDLILMDIVMPGKYDGLEASRKIHGMFKTDKRPIIVAITASVIGGNIESYLEDGTIRSVIEKPVDKIRKITNVLRPLGFS